MADWLDLTIGLGPLFLGAGGVVVGVALLIHAGKGIAQWWRE